jgi:hypothetical protein
MDTECKFRSRARPPTDHFKGLLKEAYPNHAYPIKHKLKECGMMKNFLTSGALAKGKEAEGDPGGKGTTPFPGEETVMMIHGRRPSGIATYLT